MEKRKYKKPAIQEVIFEAKFAYNNFDIAIPGQFYERVKDEYPIKQNIHLSNNENFNGNHKESIEPQVPKLRVSKKDNSIVLQVGPGIVTANEMKHITWEQFLPKIKKALDAYIDCAQPKFVTRIGIRYVNHFLLPEENININEYFDFGIRLPVAFTKLSGFNLNLLNKLESHENSRTEFQVQTTIATIPLSPGEQGSKLLLDIDCYSLQANHVSLENILNLSNEAHTIIYRLFESFLKDKTRLLMEIER